MDKYEELLPVNIKDQSLHLELKTLFKHIVDKMEFGEALIKYNKEFNDSFMCFLEDTMGEELEEIIKDILLVPEVSEIKNGRNEYIITNLDISYIDCNWENLKTIKIVPGEDDKIIKIVNFNNIGKIIQKIFMSSFIEGFECFNDNIKITSKTVDETIFIGKGIYDCISKILAKRLGIKRKNLGLVIYIPDINHWTITAASGSLIYSLFKDLFIYSDGLLIKTETNKRNLVVEKIAEAYGISVNKKYYFSCLNPKQDLIIKIISNLKSLGFSGDLGEFYIKLKDLGHLLYQQLIPPADQKLAGTVNIPELIITSFCKDFMEYINKSNTLPKELHELNVKLLEYEKVIQLLNPEFDLSNIEKINNIANENDSLILEYLRVSTLVKNYEISKIGYNFESFIKFIVSNGIQKNLLPEEFKGYLNTIKMDKKAIEETIKNFDRIFRERVLGQDQVIAPIWSLLKRWYIGVRSQKPVGSFLFCGPTGVGKTETAKLLADATFGSLITLDMSEYQTEIDATKIIGVAPGYAGYDQGAGILDKIAANPRSIILFDEIEKAHYKIFDLLLQVLDEGRLTDHKGNIVSFKECFIICTTNAHYAEIEHLGENARSKMIEILCGSFRKEFLARFNDVIKYHQLSNETMEKIFDMKIEKEIEEVSKSTGINIILIEDENYFKVKSDIIKFLDNSLGARELQRIIFQDIVSKIIDYIAEMNDSFKQKEEVMFYFDTVGKLKLANLEVSDG